MATISTAPAQDPQAPDETSTDTRTCDIADPATFVDHCGVPLTATFATPVQPGGATEKLAIPAPLPDGVERRFVAWFEWRNEADDGFVASNEGGGQSFIVSVEKTGENSTELVVRLPDPNTFWRRDGRVVVALLRGDEPTPAYVALAEATVSDRTTAVWIAVVIVVAVYLLVALVVNLRFRNKGVESVSWLRTIDPVHLTRGHYGRGSISKLQILFFSFIVFGLVVYVFLRTSVLSDLSEDILVLLGIGAAGSAAAKATAIARFRLSFDNWYWIAYHGWLTEEDRRNPLPPSWSDLIMEGGELSVTKMQSLVFSTVVGLALLLAGVMDLAAFEVPEALLALLGISQGAYVVGKVTTPPLFKELDGVMNQLRAAELAFTTKAAQNLSQLPASDDAALQASIAVARPEYEAFAALERKARFMVREVFDITRDLSEQAPRLPALPRQA